MKINKNVANKSAQYTGYLILKYLQQKKKEKISIYELYDSISKKEQINLKEMKFGMIFLYSLNIIDFLEANICIVK